MQRVFPQLNTANTSKSVSKIFYKLSERRKLKNIDGAEGRLRKIQKTLTALIKYERIEVNYHRGDEVRGYAEQLISQAIRNGPEDKETMKMANYYILEKQYVHKLFKVLVPRYQNYAFNYTRMYQAPLVYENIPGRDANEKAVLELRGNIYPSLTQANPPDHLLLHNVLLSEARKEFRTEKYKQIADDMKNADSIKE